MMIWSKADKGQKLAALTLALILGFMALAVVAPFSQSSLQTVDFPNHITAAAYVRDVLWPNPTGWDYRFFAGNPINQFYPPLSAWITALLGFILPFDIIFKALLIIAGLATPLAVYYAARKFSFAPFPAAMIALLAFALLFAYNGFLGSDFYSTFYLGNFGNGLAVPLLFLYIGRLKHDFEKGTYIWSTILLALVSLMHIFMGLAAWIFLISFALVSGREKVKYFAKHFLLSALLIAFWALPFVAKFEFAAPGVEAVQFVSLGLSGLGILVVAGISIGYLFYRKMHREMKPLIAYLVILAIIFVTGTVLQSEIHFYRFLIVMFIIAFFFPIRMLILLKKLPYFIVPVTIAVLVVAFNIGAIDYQGPEPIGLPDFGPVDGRIMVTYYGHDSWHILSEMIPGTTGNLVARGAFSESAANSQYYRLTERELRLERQRFNTEEKTAALGINWLLADDPRKINYTEKKFVTSYRRVNISLYRIGDASLAEVLNYTPGTVAEDWKTASKEWFDSSSISKVFVAAREALPQTAGTGEEEVEITELSHNTIRLRVDSEKEVPVFLKFSYYPNWKAYVNGKETKIYQALPAFMLVYGRGDIEFRYEQLPVDTAGWVLSAIGLVLLVFFRFYPLDRSRRR